MRLSGPQRHALAVGSRTAWLGCREVGVAGDTMAALERRGFAKTSHDGRRCVYHLTDAGLRERVRLLIRELPAEVLIDSNVRGILPDEALFAELARRAGFELVVYYWPTGRLGAYHARPGHEIERRGETLVEFAGDEA